MVAALISTAPRRSQAQRRAATRRRLLDASAESLAEFGYQGTTLPEVVNRAGLSNGALWRHFRTKTDLFVATALHCENLLAAEASKNDLSGMHPSRRLAAAVRILWEWVRTPSLQALMELITAARSDEELRQGLLASDTEAARIFFGVFARLVGPELSESSGFESAARLVALTLYGVALTDSLRSESANSRLQADVQRTLSKLFELD